MSGAMSKLDFDPYHVSCLMVLRLLVQIAAAQHSAAQHSTAHGDAMQQIKISGLDQADVLTVQVHLQGRSRLSRLLCRAW